MVLKCPCCLEEVQTEVEIKAGQRVECPICDGRFIYQPQRYVLPEIITSGIEFEEFLCRHINNQDGMKCEQTKASGDQGVDLIVIIGNVRIAIQCKLYSAPVGNDAVQQVVAGRIMYKCDVAMVATNSTFTGSAKELAKATDVVLVNYKDIIEVLEAFRAGKSADVNNILEEREAERGDYSDMERFMFHKWMRSPSLLSGLEFITGVFALHEKESWTIFSPCTFAVFASFYMNLIDFVRTINKSEFADAISGGEYIVEIEYAAYSKWFDIASSCFELAGMSNDARMATKYANRFKELLAERGLIGFSYPHVFPEKGPEHAILILKRNFILDEKAINGLLEVYKREEWKYHYNSTPNWSEQIH